MHILYHYPLCPMSRQARVILKEANINYNLIKEDYWHRSDQILKFNPAGELPILVEPFDIVIAGIYPVIEYINDFTNNSFMSADSVESAEIRRMISWYNQKFYPEVTKIFMNEKIIRLLKNAGAPKTEFIRIAKTNLSQHLQYTSYILRNRAYVGSESFSAADIAAAAHLSVIDYFGEIIWEQYPIIKEWYSLIKSRPSFRSILQDSIAGFIPPKHYNDLDF